MIKNSFIITFLAAAALTLAAGCTASNSHSGEGVGTAGSAPSSAGQEQAEPSAAATFNQPLMATGGDLVMLRVPSRSIAG
jgi:hypothetical protein